MLPLLDITVKKKVKSSLLKEGNFPYEKLRKNGYIICLFMKISLPSPSFMKILGNDEFYRNNDMNYRKKIIGIMIWKKNCDHKKIYFLEIHLYIIPQKT